MQLFSLLVACTDSDDKPDTGSVDSADSADSADSVDTGESNDSGDTALEVVVDLQATAQMSPNISTVMTVVWTTDAPGTRVVEFGATAAYGRQTTDDGTTDTEHDVLVVGMKPSAEVHWRVRSMIDGVIHVSEDQVLTTGPADPGLPPFHLDIATPGAFHGGLRLIPVSSEPNPLVLVDDDGEIVWWTFTEPGLTINQAFLDNDGAHILYLVTDSARNVDRGAMVRVSLADPTHSEAIPLPLAHHSFVQMDDGHVIYLASDAREVDGETVVGDVIIEVDADGSHPRPLFNTWDRWTPDFDIIRERTTNFYRYAMDWTHGNSLRYDPVTDTLLCSFHNIDAIMKMQMDGTVDWVLAGSAASPEADYTYAGEGDPFYDQHNAHLLPDGQLLLFDNGPYGLPPDYYSEVSQYALDANSHTYSETWNFDWDQAVATPLEGDVSRFADDGNTLVNWGASGAWMEVTPAGDIVWQITSKNGAFFAFGQHYPSLGGVIR